MFSSLKLCDILLNNIMLNTNNCYSQVSGNESRSNSFSDRKRLIQTNTAKVADVTRAVLRLVWPFDGIVQN